MKSHYITYNFKPGHHRRPGGAAAQGAQPGQEEGQDEIGAEEAELHPRQRRRQRRQRGRRGGGGGGRRGGGGSGGRRPGGTSTLARGAPALHHPLGDLFGILAF